MEKSFAKFDWPLIGIVMAITIIGIFNLYSAVYYWGEHGQMNIFWSQLVWLFIGIVIMFVLSFLDYRLFHKFAVHIYVAVNILLMLSVFFGKVIRGTSGWLQVGGISIQPSEFSKLAFIMIAAKFYSSRPNPEGTSFKGMIYPFVIMVIPFSLVLLQGDMGSSLFLVLIFLSLAFFAKIKWATLIFIIVVSLAAGGVAYRYVLKDYQRARIMTFVHPEEDIKGKGYHLMQSKIAVGSGKFFGKGYLKGNINKLRYLPERHTDFIFPVFAEEWGFFGGMILLSLFFSLLFMGVEIASKTRDRFGIFAAVGIVAMVFWQVVINLGGVLGLMPLTGVTLPLMSYGGSSIITVFTSIGILQNISRRRFMF